MSNALFPSSNYLAPLALGLTLLAPACRKPSPQKDHRESVTTQDAPSRAPLPQAGVPPIELRKTSAEELLQRIRESSARATVVNAWASWCGPCRAEIPMLLGLRKSLAAKGVELLFVSVDEPDSEAKALEFLRELKAEGPYWVATRPLGEFKKGLHPGWPGMLPATFLFDTEAQLRHFWGGQVFENELTPIVSNFLEGKPIEGQTTFGLMPGKDLR